MSFVVDGEQDGIITVRRYLDGWRGGTMGHGAPEGSSSRSKRTTSCSVSLDLAGYRPSAHRRKPPALSDPVHPCLRDGEHRGGFSPRSSDSRVGRRPPRQHAPATVPRSSWVYGRPNASVIMASFLHGSPSGQRFSGPSSRLVCLDRAQDGRARGGQRLRKEISLSAIARKAETYRQYKARLDGNFIDILGPHHEFHDPNDSTYPTSHPSAGTFGTTEQIQTSPGSATRACRRPATRTGSVPPAAVMDVVQADHYEIDVPPRGKVVVRKLS